MVLAVLCAYILWSLFLAYLCLCTGHDFTVIGKLNETKLRWKQMYYPFIPFYRTKEGEADKRERPSLYYTIAALYIVLFAPAVQQPFLFHPFFHWNKFIQRLCFKAQTWTCISGACMGCLMSTEVVGRRAAIEQYQPPQRHAAVWLQEQQQGSVIVHCSSTEQRRSM